MTSPYRNTTPARAGRDGSVEVRGHRGWFSLPIETARELLMLQPHNAALKDAIRNAEFEHKPRVASDLTNAACPVCHVQPNQSCDRAVIGEWYAFPLPAPWTWYFRPVYVHVHKGRLADAVTGMLPEPGAEDEDGN